MNNKFRLFISCICAVTCAAVISVSAFASSYAAGDLNGDGQVTAEDALLILQNVTGIIDKFPVEEQGSVSSEKIVASVTTDDCSEDVIFDGSKAVSLSLQYPVVEVPGNEIATKAINQTLQRVRLQELVKEDLLNDILEAWNSGADKSSSNSYEISYEVCRNSNILSLKVKMARFEYMAVASVGIETFNFDLSTGALIDITDLTSVNNFNYFVRDFAAIVAYQEVKQYNVVSSEEDMATLIGNDWYFDSEGELNYVFPAYSVAPGAYGPVDVYIGNMDFYMTDYYTDLLR